MRHDGATPSEILRHFALREPTPSVPDLMRLAQAVFELPFDAVLCLGGWWHDGTSELSDSEIDALLLKAVEARRGSA